MVDPDSSRWRLPGPDGLLVTHCCASTLRVHTICDGRIACAEWRTPTPPPVFVRCPAVLHLLGLCNWYWEDRKFI